MNLYHKYVDRYRYTGYHVYIYIYVQTIICSINDRIHLDIVVDIPIFACQLQECCTNF